MAQPVDAAAYYGTLLDSDKKPSRVMVALLTGIAKYIVKNVGDKDTKCLTPPKLAAFYKAVGGNYDSVFIELPNPQISFIYQSIGCQHTLQPTEDDFRPPSIPALTTRGFVRWQTIEILLDPNGHVPFLQRAVNDFIIINPETGERFPTDLPATCLPQEPDSAIEKWHNKCAEKLRRDSAADVRPHSQPANMSDARHPSPYIRTPHTYPATSTPRDGFRGGDYFNSKSEHLRRPKTARPVQPPKARDMPPRRSSTPPQDFEDSRGRRRSLPKDYYRSKSNRDFPPDARQSKYESDVAQEGLRAPSGGRGRRHSHPRLRRERSTSSSSWSSSSGSVTSDPPTSPLYTTRRSLNSKIQPAREKTRSGLKPDKVPIAVRYSSSSSPHPDAALPTETLRQEHRNRGLSMPNFRHGNPQVAAYKTTVEPPVKVSSPFTNQPPTYPVNTWRSESRGGASVRWRDLIDIPLNGYNFMKEPLAPDAPPAVGGPEKFGREKYRRDEFVQPRVGRRSVSHEERVRLRERERERRDWERERADSETDARLDRRFFTKIDERR